MGQAVDDRMHTLIGPTPSPFKFPSSARPLLLRRISALEERQKDHALDLIHESVVALDPQGRITYLNRAAEGLYGWQRAEIVGRAVKAVLFTDGEMFEQAWRCLRDTGEWRGEIVQRTKHGEERLVGSRWSLVRDRHSNRIQSILMIGTEISNLNLRAAEFAHEIRNPLAGIKGVADTFLQRRELSRQEREWMEAVRYAVTKIDARMRELLDVSQPRVCAIRRCALGELVRGVVVLATHQAQSINQRHGRQISVQFIDATTEPLIMHLDPARIEDAVLNLVLNAIEAIEENGEVTVCLRRRTAGGADAEAVIEVIDTGCGVPAEIRRRIFEPCFTTKREGTGLGLAAVKRTATAYHGRISFRTKRGRGSKFILALPLRSQLNLTENPK